MSVAPFSHMHASHANTFSRDSAGHTAKAQTQNGTPTATAAAAAAAAATGRSKKKHTNEQTKGANGSGYSSSGTSSTSSSIPNSARVDRECDRSDGASSLVIRSTGGGVGVAAGSAGGVGVGVGVGVGAADSTHRIDSTITRRTDIVIPSIRAEMRVGPGASGFVASPRVAIEEKHSSSSSAAKAERRKHKEEEGGVAIQPNRARASPSYTGSSSSSSSSSLDSSLVGSPSGVGGPTHTPIPIRRDDSKAKFGELQAATGAPNAATREPVRVLDVAPSLGARDLTGVESSSSLVSMSAGLAATQPHLTTDTADTITPNTKTKSRKSTRATSHSKKKQKLLLEQVSLTAQATIAANLLAEKRQLEARIAAKEATAKQQAEHVERVSEAARLYTESDSDVVFTRAREDVLVRLEESVYLAQEWDNYLACNPLPNVDHPHELNGYISRFREMDDTNPPHLALTPALDACATTEQVVTELTKRIAAAKEENNRPAIAVYERYAYLLHELSSDKLVDVTCKFLHRSDDYDGNDDFAFTQCAMSGDGTIGFGLWVHNSSRTARIKRIDFHALNVAIELPQSLQKARTAIRLIRTPYDHVSVTRPQPRNKSTEADAKRISSPASTSSLSRPSTRGDLLSSVTPSSLASSTALTDPTLMFDFDHQPPPVDARAHFVTLGGVMELYQLLLPPQAKKIHSWTMRDMTPLEKQIVIVPYPMEESHTTAATPHTQQAPIRIKFTLPPHIFLGDREPVFGYWHDGGVPVGRSVREIDTGLTTSSSVVGSWRQEGVNILDYDPKKREVSLSVPTIRPVAVIQPRALDFPYRTWSIMPVRESQQYAEPSLDDHSHTCRLEVSGSRFSVCFEVRGLLARLVSPGDPFLRRFHAEWTFPGQLAESLASVGIRVTPSDADAEYCRKPLKAPTLVQTLHGHLSLLTQIFDVASCPHNVARSTRQCTFRMRLNQHSSLLASAATKKCVLDWEAEAEEDERLDNPDESYKTFPSSLRSDSESNLSSADLAALQRQDDIDAQIRAMELEDEKAEAEAAAAREREMQAAQMTRDASAGRIKSAKSTHGDRHTAAEPNATSTPTPLPLPSSPTPSERYALGFEWVSILAELIDAPSDPSLAAAAAAASRIEDALPPATSGRPLTAAERATGSIYEGLPPGALIKFTLIQDVKPDASDPTHTQPLAGQVSHFSLRRCLLAYFHDKTPHDLTTAMGMAIDKKATPAPASTPHTDSPLQYRFIPFDPLTLQTQQTVRRTLNLFRPFQFC